jgi:hypothetical protein
VIPDAAAPKPRVVALRQTSDAFLVQWQGRTDDDRPIYIRFKDYHLSVRLGPTGDEDDSALLATPWFDAEDVDVIDYWTIPLETVCAITGVIVDCAVQPCR